MTLLHFINYLLIINKVVDNSFNTNNVSKFVQHTIA